MEYNEFEVLGGDLEQLIYVCVNVSNWAVGGYTTTSCISNLGVEKGLWVVIIEGEITTRLRTYQK